MMRAYIFCRPSKHRITSSGSWDDSEDNSVTSAGVSDPFLAFKVFKSQSSEFSFTALAAIL